MNKAKLGFVTFLARVGLEEKATDSLVNEMKKQLPTLDAVKANTAKLKEVHAQYEELAENMKAEKSAIEDEIVELRQSINKLNVSSNIVEAVMEINKQIEGKEARIKALAGAMLALGKKGKMDQFDLLAECYSAFAELGKECRELVTTAQPLVNGLNKESIVKAVNAIDAEVSGHCRLYNNVSREFGAMQVTHNGVRLSTPNDSPMLYHRIN
ncbi:hypothetical protein QNH39_18845 [Neobacillus novalis]|uniref:Uncharacterized protein n=1 Tax=Neobacillus novalis TaxID=220687 RepID=A0AA95MIZ3_9BACI|nr:hypothetical protein [Neobacillus novalis]WHY84694.1 hypothetical protein QNH39_18845 [Neobacillus novalis]